MTCATGFFNAIRVLILRREPSPLPVAIPTGFTTGADPVGSDVKVEVKQKKPPGHHSEGLLIVRGDNRNGYDNVGIIHDAKTK